MVNKSDTDVLRTLYLPEDLDSGLKQMAREKGMPVPDLLLTLIESGIAYQDMLAAENKEYAGLMALAGEPVEAELRDGIPSKKLVRLRRRYIENAPENLATIPGLDFDSFYIVLAEVETIRHYVILNLDTGQVLPGMFHLERFERVPEDEI